MRTTVDVREVEKLIAAGAQIVEVLPREEYEEHHLPGALSMPLSSLGSWADELDRDRPVVVYCYDMQCDQSPRAAAQLVQLGMAEVYDFAAGKMAWLAAGLPSEGQLSDLERAGTLASDVPTCDAADDIATIAETLKARGLCVVVDGSQVVLGSLGLEALELAPETVVADIMQPAPLTVRPSIPRSELQKMFDRKGIDQVLVTTFAGELLGAIRRSDLAP